VALTQEQKSSIRRHMGYPVIGLLKISPAGAVLGSASVGYRFFEAYGQLEYKLNNLNPDEEARMTGANLGAAILTGPQPNAGDTVSLTISSASLSSPQTVTTTAGAPNGNYDMRLNLVNGLVSAISLNTVLQAAGVYSAAPYGTGPYSQNADAVPELGIVAPFAFTLTGAGSGNLVPQITSNGVQLPPVASLDGSTTVHGYLPILDGLEGAYAGASQNLDTKKAAVWESRSNELAMRASLYKVWQIKLSEYLGIPLNQRGQARYDVRNYGAMRFA
jgi:hypothetical protein